jgi:hypothetical protein
LISFAYGIGFSCFFCLRWDARYWAVVALLLLVPCSVKGARPSLPTGIAALVPLGFYFAIALKPWRLYASSGILTRGLAAFGVMVALFNGIVQEEALFAPPALGLPLCLTGLVIGNQIQAQTAFR